MIEPSIATGGLLILLLVLLILSSGFFSGSEIALFSLPSHTLRSYRQNSDPRKRQIAQLLSHPRDLLVTVFILNTVVNILLQNTTSTLFGPSAGWLLKVGVPLVITLLLGEVIPKLIAIRASAKWSYVVTPIITFFQNTCGPIRRFMTKITTPLSRAMFFFLKEDPVISRDELKHVIEESLQTKILHKEEAELIDGYLDLREAKIKEIMRPKEDILYYDINTPLEELEHLFVDQEVTRIPVCDGEVNNLLGLISARDFFINHDSLNDPQALTMLLQKPHYIPESASGPAALRELDRVDHVLVMVVDEYGSITGLVSREDLVEEVIGDVTDRRDRKSRFTRAGKNVVIASGKLELDEFEDLFGVALHSSSGMITVGGWLTEQLGGIPKTGQYHQNKNFLFHVLSADPNRIRRLYIRKLEHVPKYSTEAQ